MRAEFALSLACALIAVPTAARAQALPNLAPTQSIIPANPIVTRGGGIGGSGIGSGVGAGGVQTEAPTANRGKSPLVSTGQGHFGAGTGGLGLGMGNAVGGVNDIARAAAGGLRDGSGWGSAVGGVQGTGRGLGVGSGGLRDTVEAGNGISTGGVRGDSTGKGGLGVGAGGIKDQTSLGSATGGFREGANSPRFRQIQ